MIIYADTVQYDKYQEILKILTLVSILKIQFYSYYQGMFPLLNATQPSFLMILNASINALVGISPNPRAVTVTIQSHCHDAILSFLYLA